MEKAEKNKQTNTGLVPGNIIKYFANQAMNHSATVGEGRGKRRRGLRELRSKYHHHHHPNYPVQISQYKKGTRKRNVLGG